LATLFVVRSTVVPKVRRRVRCALDQRSQTVSLPYCRRQDARPAKGFGLNARLSSPRYGRLGVEVAQSRKLECHRATAVRGMDSSPMPCSRLRGFVESVQPMSLRQCGARVQRRRSSGGFWRARALSESLAGRDPEMPDPGRAAREAVTRPAAPFIAARVVWSAQGVRWALGKRTERKVVREETSRAYAGTCDAPRVIDF